MTKSDLADLADDPVTIEQMQGKKDDIGATLTAETSSKEWEDFNVHKAFNKTLTSAYSYKYEPNEEPQQLEDAEAKAEKERLEAERI